MTNLNKRVFEDLYLFKDPKYDLFYTNGDKFAKYFFKFDLLCISVGLYLFNPQIEKWKN